jgi:hypothetical protein
MSFVQSDPPQVLFYRTVLCHAVPSVQPEKDVAWRHSFLEMDSAPPSSAEKNGALSI